MLAPPGRTQVSRRTSPELPNGLSVPSAGGAPDRGGPSSGFPGGSATVSTTAASVPPEQSRGPQLSEQLDMLADVLAARRLADLERRGLFLRPEVF